MRKRSPGNKVPKGAHAPFEVEKAPREAFSTRNGAKAPREAFAARVAALQREHLKPPPRLTISEWADAERRLSPEASAEPGTWRTSRAAYQRAMMDAITDPRTHTVVAMLASQIG